MKERMVCNYPGCKISDRNGDEAICSMCKKVSFHLKCKEAYIEKNSFDIDLTKAGFCYNCVSLCVDASNRDIDGHSDKEETLKLSTKKNEKSSACEKRNRDLGKEMVTFVKKHILLKKTNCSIPTKLVSDSDKFNWLLINDYQNGVDKSTEQYLNVYPETKEPLYFYQTGLNWKKNGKTESTLEKYLPKLLLILICSFLLLSI